VAKAGGEEFDRAGGGGRLTFGCVCARSGSGHVLRLVTKMRLLILAAVLLGTAASQSGGPSDSTFERLAKVERFAFGGIGYAGVISQGEKDYRAILSRPSAMVDFERLLSVGSPQAKGYALVGIRALDLDRFKELSHSLHDSKEGLLTERGCIVSHESLRTVLNRIEAGEYSKGK
jgi:hypothetical protein